MTPEFIFAIAAVVLPGAAMPATAISVFDSFASARQTHLGPLLALHPFVLFDLSQGESFPLYLLDRAIGPRAPGSGSAVSAIVIALKCNSI